MVQLVHSVWIHRSRSSKLVLRGVDRHTNRSWVLLLLGPSLASRRQIVFAFVILSLPFPTPACAFDDLSTSKVKLRAKPSLLGSTPTTNKQWHHLSTHQWGPKDQRQQEGVTRLSLSTASGTRSALKPGQVCCDHLLVVGIRLGLSPQWVCCILTMILDSAKFACIILNTSVN